MLVTGFLTIWNTKNNSYRKCIPVIFISRKWLILYKELLLWILPWFKGKLLIMQYPGHHNLASDPILTELLIKPRVRVATIPNEMPPISLVANPPARLTCGWLTYYATKCHWTHHTQIQIQATVAIQRLSLAVCADNSRQRQNRAKPKSGWGRRVESRYRYRFVLGLRSRFGSVRPQSEFASVFRGNWKSYLDFCRSVWLQEYLVYGIWRLLSMSAIGECETVGLPYGPIKG